MAGVNYFFRRPAVLIVAGQFCKIQQGTDTRIRRFFERLVFDGTNGSRRAAPKGSVNSIASSALLVTDYLRLFSGRAKHIRSYVGALHAAYRNTSASCISFEQTPREIGALGSFRPFLNIDIEGSEYSILTELLSAAQSTTGLVIEFHECTKHLDEITAFVKRYPLRLAHIMTTLTLRSMRLDTQRR